VPRDVSYSEEYVAVTKEWLDRYFRVTKPNEDGRYFLVGRCPRCHDVLQSPLGEVPRKLVSAQPQGARGRAQEDDRDLRVRAEARGI
jgi:hypothetical protein